MITRACHAERVTDPDLAALFAQVYADPADDAARAVLADALLAIGDPRGELIAAQLQPAADSGRRAMRLIQQHGLTWLGALRDVVVPVAYERGFVASCVVVAEVAAHLAHPEWATVHTIELPPARVGFAPRPHMRALRRLSRVPPAVLLELANDHHAALQAIAVDAVYAPAFDDLLARYLPPDPAGTLILRDVPFDRADHVRALAGRHRRMKLELLVRPPPAARGGGPA